MAKFVVIDHSLKRVGGHHYDYAVNVLREARRAGYEVVLGAHRRFRDDRDLPPDCRVFTPFRYSTYSPYAAYASSRSKSEAGARGGWCYPGSGGTLAAFAVPSWLRRWRERWINADRQRRLDRFAGACDELFRQVELHEGDHVFFPTLSEFDLCGLVQHLKDTGQSRRARWHLQFHFNIFDGREPEYAPQADRLERMRVSFQESLREVTEHRLYFYTTSGQLAAQYNRLGVAAFRPLTYPVHPAFQPRRAASAARRPLRIACAGAIRKEKGQQLLADLVRDLWPDYLSPGKVQLFVQSDKSWFRLPLPDGRTACRPGRRGSPASAADPVVCVRHPLGADEYVDFVCGADVGLLLYDSDRYYVRRAGVLGELLSAGVPVMVPAGCWLSEQIAEPIYRHLEALGQDLPVVGRLGAGDIAWRAACDPAGEPHLTFGGPSSP